MGKIKYGSGICLTRICCYRQSQLTIRDLEDSIDCGINPPDGSQSWIAPYAQEAFDKYRGMFNEYGLGVKTGIDLPNEKAGLIPTKDWKYSRICWTNVRPGFGRNSFPLSLVTGLAKSKPVMKASGPRPLSTIRQPPMLFKLAPMMTTTKL